MLYLFLHNFYFFLTFSTKSSLFRPSLLKSDYFKTYMIFIILTINILGSQMFSLILWDHQLRDPKSFRWLIGIQINLCSGYC